MPKKSDIQRYKSKGSIRKGSKKGRTHPFAIYIGLILSVLFITSFLLRAHGYQNPHRFSWDEDLYVTMGYQLSKDVTEY
ncbi:MAG: hypothetical protein ACE5K2_07385, partial [Candidatus Zixiibacteriota bacterium]